MSKHVPPPTGEPIAGPELPQDSAAEREDALQRGRGLRKEAADEIDRLLSFLDAIDDTDVDSQCDDGPIDDVEQEPSLCGVTAAGANMPADIRGDDCELDDSDDEPSLGSIESVAQGGWSAGANDDREYEHDGSEPSLCGITAGMSFGNDRDLEADDADNEEGGDNEPSLGSTATIERAVAERGLPVAVFLEVALRLYLVDTGYIDEEAAN